MTLEQVVGSDIRLRVGIRAIQHRAIRWGSAFAGCMCLTFVLCLFISTLQPVVSALSQDDINAINNDTVWYDSAGGALPACTTGNLPSVVPSNVSTIFDNAAAKYDIPPALIAAIYWQEHGGRWADPNEKWATSGTGAQGPFQFEPATWTEYGVDGNGDGIKDEQNIVDAAFSAANDLSQNGAGKGEGSTSTMSIQHAVWNYNHDQGYLNSVIGEYHLLVSLEGGDCSGTIGSSNNPVPPVGQSIKTQYHDGGPASAYTPAFSWVPAGGFRISGDPGQCTWWASYNWGNQATGAHVNWGGNANVWRGGAAAQGWPVVTTPSVGAVVTWATGYNSVFGHVAVVTNVATNSYTVSEMNSAAGPNGKPLWQVDVRTVAWPDKNDPRFIPKP